MLCQQHILNSARWIKRKENSRDEFQSCRLLGYCFVKLACMSDLQFVTFTQTVPPIPMWEKWLEGLSDAVWRSEKHLASLHLQKRVHGGLCGGSYWPGFKLEVWAVLQVSLYNCGLWRKSFFGPQWTCCVTGQRIATGTKSKSASRSCCRVL